jgi:hypothetical protein
MTTITDTDQLPDVPTPPAVLRELLYFTAAGQAAARDAFDLLEEPENNDFRTHAAILEMAVREMQRLFATLAQQLSTVPAEERAEEEAEIEYAPPTLPH